MKEILKFGMTLEKYTSLHHILATVVDECVMKFDESGLSVVAVNLANTSMVKAFMPKRAFMEYEIENTVRIGVDLHDLEERLLNDKHGRVDLALSEQDGRHDCQLSHDIFCETLCLLDPDTMKNPNWKEIKTDCNFSLLASVLRKVSSRSDFLCVECGNSHVVFSDEFHDDYKWATVPIPISCGISVKARYSAEWFQDITSAIISERVNIRFSDDYPCVIKSGFGNGCVAEWLVAPRIGSD